MKPGALVDVGVQVRLTESPIHHRGSHLEPWVQGQTSVAAERGALNFAIQEFVVSSASDHPAQPHLPKALAQDLAGSQPGSAGKNQLRRELRQRRRSLSRQQQQHASMGLCRQLMALPAFRNSHRIAAYIANDGEISPQPLLELAWRLGKQVYLPVLHPFRKGHLFFMQHLPDQPLALNRFGIPEPLCHHDSRCPAWTLDLVLTPLVGFDEAGNRMGMGGGFYDRTFAFMQSGLAPRRPRLVGVAHECQKAASLPQESWDIGMDLIVTDRGIYGER